MATRSRGAAATVGQGLATWLAFAAIGRVARPIRWFLGQIRRAVFNWSEYTRYVREQTVIEGLFNGSKFWLAIGGGVWGFRALRRATGHSERIVITQVPRKLPRKQRRAAAKAG